MSYPMTGTLSGTYTGVDSWDGFFQATFCDTASCGCAGGISGQCAALDCNSAVFVLSGTR